MTAVLQPVLIITHTWLLCQCKSASYIIYTRRDFPEYQGHPSTHLPSKVSVGMRFMDQSVPAVPHKHLGASLGLCVFIELSVRFISEAYALIFRIWVPDKQILYSVQPGTPTYFVCISSTLLH